jgi:hypothetical protein
LGKLDARIGSITFEFCTVVAGPNITAEALYIKNCVSVVVKAFNRSGVNTNAST